MNPTTPLYKLLVATAVDERPTFASTIYESVLEYVHLHSIRQRCVLWETISKHSI